MCVVLLVFAPGLTRLQWSGFLFVLQDLGILSEKMTLSDPLSICGCSVGGGLKPIQKNPGSCHHPEMCPGRLSSLLFLASHGRRLR